METVDFTPSEELNVKREDFYEYFNNYMENWRKTENREERRAKRRDPSFNMTIYPTASKILNKGKCILGYLINSVFIYFKR